MARLEQQGQMVHRLHDRARRLGAIYAQAYPPDFLHPIPLDAHAADDAGAALVDEVAEGLTSFATRGS
jgi:hypothetical protein